MYEQFGHIDGDFGQVSLSRVGGQMNSTGDCFKKCARETRENECGSDESADAVPLGGSVSGFT